MASHTSVGDARPELRGGAVAALQGVTNVMVPTLLFVGLFGAMSLAAAFWATLVVAIVAPLLRLLLGGAPAIMQGPRAASLATYVGLVLQVCLENTALTADGHGIGLSLAQLRIGLAAGSLMFMVASMLVLLAGWLKLGNILKMIPTPVTAGISNGTALLLVWLAVKQVVHHSWAAAVTAGCMIVIYALWPRLQARARQLAVLPAVIIAMFAGLALATLLEPAVVRPPLPDTDAWRTWVSLLLWPDLLGQAPGRLLMIGLPGAFTLALVMVLENFTAAGVMQTRFGVRTEPNRELLALGGANLISAVLGGMPCTGSTVYSAANWQAGGRGKLAAATCVAVTAALLLSMGQWLIAMPTGLMAGLLLMQAIVLANPPFVRRLKTMLMTRKLRDPESQDLGFWITLAITLAGFLGSLIWACFLGIGLSCLVVLRRVSDNLSAHWTYLDHNRSRRVRSPAQGDALTQLAHSVGILKLTGHLFFGNSTRLMQLLDELHPDAVAVLLDVSQVQDADPSGIEALDWLIKELSGRDLKVVLSGLQSTRSLALRHGLKDVAGINHALDVDYGLEACEDVVLIDLAHMTAPALATPLENNRLLANLTPQEINAVLLLGHAREVGAGQALFHKDAPADGVWLIEQGQVSILSGERAESSRLATYGPGQFLGEMGFIDGHVRSATATADADVRALLLDNHGMATLLDQHPGAVWKITRNIARELSQRVRSTTALLPTPASEPGGAALSSVAVR